MKNVFVYPWVGKFYGKKGYYNKKIMILGESHYCNECDVCSASIENKCYIRKELIERFLKYKNSGRDFEKWFNTYTKFANIFIGKKCDGETIIKFWHSILFYNYVQEPTEAPRKHPTKEMFKNEDNEKGFFNILKNYSPDVIIAWGKRLWKNLPNDRFSDGKTILGRSSRFYNNGKNDIPIFFIDHPSTGKNYDLSKRYIKRVKKEISLVEQ
jgi:hypothetical protein